MKKLLILPVMAAMLLYACSKENKPVKTIPTDTIANKIDVQKLSDALTVQNGESLKGEIPKANSSIVLPSKTDTVSAINGQYVVILPPANAGHNFLGYCVKIKGTDNYFKVTLHGNNGRKKMQGHTPFGRTQDLTDSVLSIQLPPGTDTGSVTLQYTVIDSIGYVSNMIDLVMKTYDDNTTTGDGRLVAGAWQWTRYQDLHLSDNWVNIKDFSSSYQFYNCVDGKLQFTPQNTDYYILNNRSRYDSVAFTYDSATHIFTDYDLYESYDLSLDSSTCDKPYYTHAITVTPTYGITYWHYNNSTQQFIYVTLAPGNLYITTQQISELTENRFVKVEDYYNYEFIRL